MTKSATREAADKVTFTQTEVTAKDTAARAGRKNLIINGAMQVAQRGTTGTLNNGGSGFHSADRFYSAEEGGFTGAFTVSNDTDSPKGFSNSTKWDCTTADTSLAADDTFFMDYKPEAQDLQHLNYGTSDALQMTMSFWIKSNKTGTYVIWLYQYDDNRHVQMQYTINTADTWEYKTLLVPADTTGVIDNDTGAGLALRFIMGAGSTWTSGTAPTTWASLVTANRYVGQTVNLADSTANYMNITGLQLETGSVATDFEHRSYGEELALCQRYYEVIADGSVSQVQTFGIGHGYKSDQINWFYQFKVSKRTEAFTLEVVSTSTGYRARNHSTNKYSTTLGMSANLQSINQIEGYMTAISGITEQSCWSVLLNQPSSKIAVSAEL